MASFDNTIPVRLRGDYDESVSRWLWLVKWLLLIPHFIVLVFLHIAMFVVTVIAFFAILFTGRYPRALGTDKYPPFTLRSTDYPADFDVEYPERLSRGLVLVKWWLLAIPHYLILAAIFGGLGRMFAHHGSHHCGAIPLFVILIVVVFVALLFTGRYPRGLFGLLLGINRWIYRVRAYALLMRDEYPPFRLDQGPHEPEQSVQEAVQ